MTDLKELIQLIKKLPEDQAETVLRNAFQNEWGNGHKVAAKTFESIADLQGQAAAQGANNLPTGYE